MQYKSVLCESKEVECNGGLKSQEAVVVATYMSLICGLAFGSLDSD